MSHWYWIAVFIAMFAFGGMSKHKGVEGIYDVMWICLYLLACVTALFLSGGVVVGIITAIALIWGNGLLWGFIRGIG